MKIVTLGPAGTNCHQAALDVSKGQHEIVFAPTNSEVPKQALYWKCLGIVPIGNSRGGLVQGTIAGFWLGQRTPPKLFVIGEVRLPIEHRLLARPGQRLDRIKGVLSHPQAFIQCDEHLRKLGLSRTEVSSTAEAARLVSTERRWRQYAAIASSLAAETYHLNILMDRMHDARGNRTRFHVLAQKPAERSKRDLTAIIFRTNHGEAIQIAMQIMVGVRAFSVTPIPLIKETGVYFEVLGNQASQDTKTLLAMLQKKGRVMVLGSYPAPEDLWRGTGTMN